MKPLVKKSKKEVRYTFFMLILLVVTSICLIGLGDEDQKIYLILFAPVFAVLVITLIIKPKVYVNLDDNGDLVIYDGTRVRPEEIADVSYHEYHRYGHSNDTIYAAIRLKDVGDVELKTTDGRDYRFVSVADCEESAKELIRIMYQAKGAKINEEETEPSQNGEDYK